MAQNDFPDDDWLFDLQVMEAEERDNFTLEEWWEHTKTPALDAALRDLEKAGCPRVRLLEDLREIENLSGGYSIPKARDFAKIVRTLERASEMIEGIEMTPLMYLMPNERVRSEDLRTYLKALSKAHADTRHSARPKQAKEIVRLTAWVSRKVRSRSPVVNKKRQHEALAILIAAVTSQRRTKAAQRVASSRERRLRLRTNPPKRR